MPSEDTQFKKGNIFSIGNNGGQAPKYDNVEELESSISSYFGSLVHTHPETGEESIAPSTITGLALYLGFCDKQSLYDYGKKAEFSCLIKRARTCIENHYENSLNGKASTGAIFALKNMGWADRTEITHNDNRDKAEQSKLIMEALKNKSRNK